jgi:hypothetical protein
MAVVFAAIVLAIRTIGVATVRDTMLLATIL